MLAWSREWEGVPCFPQGCRPRGQGPHLLPDGVVAEEAAHLALGQRAARVGVLVAGKQVHAEGPHDTAVEHPEGDSVTGSGVLTRDPPLGVPVLGKLGTVTLESGLKEVEVVLA